MKSRHEKQLANEKFWRNALAIERSRAIRDSMEMCLLVTALSLNEQFGFGASRLDRFSKEFMKHIDAVNSDTLSIQDLRDKVDKIVQMDLKSPKKEA